MSVTAAQVSVATSATALNAVDSDDSPFNSNLFRNKHATASVFLGPSTVTTANGFELAAGEAVSVDLRGGEILYGIVATGTATVHVLRAGA